MNNCYIGLVIKNTRYLISFLAGN